MKSGFSDPVAIKSQRPNDKPIDGKNSPWDFRCPEYDQRTGPFVSVGTNYGVGHNQPVGREGNPKQRVATMPFGRVNTMKVNE